MDVNTPTEINGTKQISFAYWTWFGYICTYAMSTNAETMDQFKNRKYFLTTMILILTGINLLNLFSFFMN